MTPVRASFSLDENMVTPPAINTPRPVRKRTGFFVPINPETGDIDMSRANPEQIAKLSAVIGKKEEPKETPKIKSDINPALIEQFYSVVEILIQRAGKMLLKWPSELASEMYFSPDKKANLIGPTKALADEFAPMWIVEHQAFIAFGAALSSGINDMVQKATERYVLKVLKGEAPPPPGFKFPVRAPTIATSQQPIPNVSMQSPQEPPVKTPENGKPTVTGAAGFIPSIPSGIGVQ